MNHAPRIEINMMFGSSSETSVVPWGSYNEGAIGAEYMNNDTEARLASPNPMF